MNKLMKLYFFTALLFCVLFSSCEDLNYGGQPSLNFHHLDASKNIVNLVASDTEQIITVSAADATPWRLEGYDASWLTISPSSGIGDASITVHAAANPAIEERTTTAKLVSTDIEYKHSVEIEFKQEEGYIKVDKNTVGLPSEECEDRLVISSNLNRPWHLEGYDATWLTISPSSGSGDATLTMHATPNPFGKERSTTVELVSTDKEFKYSLSIKITQTKGYIKADTTAVKFGANASEESIGIFSNLSDIAWKATSNSTWFSATPSADGKSLIITTSENQAGIRVGKVCISSVDDEISSTILVVQEAHYYYNQTGPCYNENHPHSISMGDGIKWSCCNVGAKNPIENGDYFAWGETKPKNEYDWSTYKYCKGTETTLTKYCGSSSYGTIDNKSQLEISDDAARANWGGTWRMPTIDEMEKLSNNCIWVWTTINYVNGYLVIAPNDNMLFFPAAGVWWLGSSNIGSGFSGSYWTSSSSSHDYYPIVADCLDFDRNSQKVSIYSREEGLTVRPITE